MTGFWSARGIGAHDCKCMLTYKLSQPEFCRRPPLFRGERRVCKPAGSPRIGALIVAAINSGLVFFNINPLWQNVVTGVVIIHVATTVCSRRRPRFVQKTTQSITDPLRTLLFGHEVSAQHYSHADISPYFWVNGRPPKEESFLAMARDNFANYSLEIGGLVERQLHLTLSDLRAMPKRTQITKHCCIQGWSGVAEWGADQNTRSGEVQGYGE